MKILVIFGSLLGKTKRIAVLIGKELQKAGFQEVKVKDVRDTDLNEIKDFDLVIMGCSTWDDGALQFDFREFHKKLMRAKFPGQKFAVFGLGGHKYPHFCTAPDILAGAIRMSGGTLVTENLKLDLDHDEAIDKCDKEAINWTKSLVERIISNE